MLPYYRSVKFISVVSNLRFDIWKRHLKTSSFLNDAQVKMPALSPTMSTGTIVKWSKKEGETVSAGDVLCEVQTDKAIVAMETDEEGILAKIIVSENTPDVPVGRLIALIVDEGKDWKNVAIPDEVKSQPLLESVSASPIPVSQSQSSGQKAEAAKSHIAPVGESIVGPAGKLLLQTYGIDQKTIPRSAHRRAVLKGEIMEYINKNKLKPKAVAQEAPKSPKPKKPIPPAATKNHFVDVAVTPEKQAKARQFLSSKFHTPHAYSRVVVDIDYALEALKSMGKDGTTITIADFVIKACASALREVPQVYCYFDGEKLHYLPSVDMCVCSEDSTDSVVSPVVRNIDRLSIQQISRSVKEISSKIRANDFSSLDCGECFFGFCNGDELGLQEFTAILRPPQTAVLSLGQVTETLGQNGSKSYRCVLTLSYDNRAIGDDVASKFLAVLKLKLAGQASFLLDSETSAASLN